MTEAPRSYPEHDALRQAVRAIIEANNDFMVGLPEDWEGDPLQDAIYEAAKLLGTVTDAQGAPRCDRCGSSGDTYVLCSGCGSLSLTSTTGGGVA